MFNSLSTRRGSLQIKIYISSGYDLIMSVSVVRLALGWCLLFVLLSVTSSAIEENRLISLPTQNMNLNQTFKDHAQLIGMNLSGMNLSGTNLNHSELQGSDLRGTNLSRSHLNQSSLFDAKMVGILQGMIIHQSGRHFSRVLTGCWRKPHSSQS